ncbi:hypothetical protein ACHAXR_004245, partial [Thalassiosira sp. AJA248-18]
TPNNNSALAATKENHTQTHVCDINNSSGLDPFSIASAVANLRNLHKEIVRTGKDSSSSSGSGSAATDVVAVVLSTTILQAPPPNIMPSSRKTPNQVSNNSRIHLLVGDQTLPRGQCARVSLTVSSSTVSSSFASLLGINGMGGRSLESHTTNNMNHVDASDTKKNAQLTGTRLLGQLQPGDVVRWNRLEVRNDYEHDDSTSDKKRKLANYPDDEDSTSDNTIVHHPLLSVACDLSSSWRDPVAGPLVARLCRIIPKFSYSSTASGMQSSTQQYQLNDGYDLEWASIIPPSMETSKETVMKLANWYCANARPHFSKSTAILPTNQPRKRRKLREITAPNLLSHIVVKVLRCEKAISKYSTPIKTTEDPVVTHVTLSDGAESDDLLGMGGSVNHGRSSSLPKSISAVLLQSMKEGSHVLLTHTLSQNVSPPAVGGGGASLQGRESLVLVPTRETTANILTSDHPYFVREKSTREEENPFASQPLTLERASQLFSMTQQHSPPIINDSILLGHCRGVMAVVAPLMDIIVDGIDTSFIEGSHWRTPHRLSSFLIDCPSVSTGFEAIKLCPSYRSATLLLDQNLVSSEVVVNADGPALKLLCMDVPVKDMVINDPTMTSVINDPTMTSNPYICHVGELLKALCTERVPIRWVLEQESECNWFVTNATLLEI